MTPTTVKRVNYAGAVASLLLWALASFTGWINSVSFVSHISMFTMFISFMAAARADAPNEGG